VGYCYSLGLDENYLYSAGEDKLIKRWDIETGSLQKSYKGHSQSVVFIFLHGDFLFSSSMDASALQWDKTTGAIINRFYTTPTAISVTCLLANSEFLFIGTQQTVLLLIQFRLSDGSTIKTFEGGHRDSITAIANTVDGLYLISGSFDSLIIKWSIATGNSVFVLRGPIAYSLLICRTQ
jgi:WD40 repeat protein